MKNKLLAVLLACIWLFSKPAFAQQGKDLAFTTATSTVVNVYTTLTSNAFTGNTIINVASTAGFAVGDLIYIIQMQGAVLNAYQDSTLLLDTTNSYLINNALPYGKILNISTCGNNEFAQVNAILGSTITL